MRGTVELVFDPVDEINKYSEYGFPEMSRRESAFLCGLISKFKPHKILEVGVAQGGTTALIFEALKESDSEIEFFSVDINNVCYTKPTEKTGFLRDIYLKDHKKNPKLNHRFLLGNTVAKALDEIGDNIDFVILDTMHFLPGELLDMISIYKSLSENAVIVFHDVAQSLNPVNSPYGSPLEYASLTTLSVLSGEKFFLDDPGKISNFGNIGAIRFDERTPASEENLFDALYLSWNYMPDDWQIEEYRGRIIKEWDFEKYQRFEQALELNTYALYRRRRITLSKKKLNEKIDEIIHSDFDLYIYGAGLIGRKLKKFFEGRGRKIAGFIVTKKDDCKADVYTLDEIDWNQDKKILLGLNWNSHLDVMSYVGAKVGMDKFVLENGIGFDELMELVNDSETTTYNDRNGYSNSIRTAEELGKI